MMKERTEVGTRSGFGVLLRNVRWATLLGAFALLLTACGMQAAIDEVVSVSVDPASATRNVDQSVTLTATVETTGEASDAVTWSVSPDANTDLVAAGDSATFSASAVGTYEVTATSSEDATKSATSVITVVEAGAIESVTVTPSTATVEVGESTQFDVDVVATGGFTGDVAWTVTPAVTATVDDGLFVASEVGDYTVTATSTEDDSKADSATVTVHPAAIRINAGATSFAYSYEAVDGRIFVGDQGSNFGQVNSVDVTTQIAGTDDDELFRSERFGVNFTYAFPAAVDGTYEVTLHFAEIFPAAGVVGGRLIDVNVEGQVVLDDYDIYVEAGDAVDAVVSVTEQVLVEDGTVNIQLLGANGSVAPEAKISAIEVEFVAPLAP